MNQEEKIKQALFRGVEKIYPSLEALEKRLKSGQKIRLYCGYDPTASTLHLGHTITLRKLAQFQELGHEVIMLIGDFTGMIGDPTDKAATRKKLSREQVLKNAKNYKKLAGKILKFTGPNPAKLMYNSQWNDKLSFVELIELASNFTVQQMLARDMFQERLKNNRPIHLHEFLYPIAQSYDSVAMDVDLEIGGSDQVFNMLCGRDLIKILKNKEKFVLTTKLLTDPSGQKMGKSEGNMVALDEKPNEMFGQIMAWLDQLIAPGFELLTDVPTEEINQMQNQIKQNQLNPRDAKARLAREITAIFHNKKAALEAEKEFSRVFKEKEKPSQMPVVKLAAGEYPILDLLVKTKLVSSKSQAKRLIEQGGVKIDNQNIKDWQEKINIQEGTIIQVGKRKFLRIS